MPNIGHSGDTDTRDIAVIANTKVDQHLQDCAAYRAGVMRTLGELRETFNANAEQLGLEMKDLSKRNADNGRMLAMILGGLIILTKIPDLLTTFKMLHP